MKTNHLTYIGKILNDGHLPVDDNIKKNLRLKEGDKLEISLKKLNDEFNMVSDVKLSEQANQYIDYLVGSGIKEEALKKVIKEIRAIDDKYQTMPRSELIKQAFAIAARRAKKRSQKHHLDIEQLSEDQLILKVME